MHSSLADARVQGRTRRRYTRTPDNEIRSIEQRRHKDLSTLQTLPPLPPTPPSAEFECKFSSLSRKESERSDPATVGWVAFGREKAFQQEMPAAVRANNRARQGDKSILVTPDEEPNAQRKYEGLTGKLRVTREAGAANTESVTKQLDKEKERKKVRDVHGNGKNHCEVTKMEHKVHGRLDIDSSHSHKPVPNGGSTVDVKTDEDERGRQSAALPSPTPPSTRPPDSPKRSSDSPLRSDTPPSTRPPDPKTSSQSLLSGQNIVPRLKLPASGVSGTEKRIEEVPKGFEQNRMAHSDDFHSNLCETPIPDCAIREYLIDSRFSCGLISDDNRSDRQKLCYNLYFNIWKRRLVTGIVLFHSALAFVELHPDVYSRRTAWKPAYPWVQVLHFLFVLVYIADSILMAIGLTSENLDPRRNVRNLSFVVVVVLLASDTLLTASEAMTSSFSLPLRGVFLMSQLPGTVRIFSLWLRMICISIPTLLSLLFAMTILAIIAVIGIRHNCPFQECGVNMDCATSGLSADCQGLLNQYSNFPSTLSVLWNLAGGSGHMENLQPMVETNLAFGMIYFVVSSAVCTVLFRFMWLAMMWHSIRDWSCCVARAERLRFMQLLSSTLMRAQECSKYPLINVTAQVLAGVWPELTVQQCLKVLKTIHGHDSKDMILTEHVSALAWLLHADVCSGFSLYTWMRLRATAYWDAASQTTGGSEISSSGITRILFFLPHYCTVLSFVMLVISTWLPDVGFRCRLSKDLSSVRVSACSVNLVFESLDVIVCCVFCFEVVRTFATERLSMFSSSICHVYKMLEVMTEALMICIFFRGEGIGNRALVLRLLRVPRLLCIAYRYGPFRFFVDFTQVTIAAAAQIWLLGVIFLYFFGTATWKSVAFNAARSPEIALDFSELSSTCYSVYLMIIGDDWDAHAKAIFGALDSDAQKFGFMVLLVFQFVGGQVLLYMFVSVVFESWRMCRDTHAVFLDAHAKHSIRFKRIRKPEGLPSPSLQLTPWATSTFCLGKTGMSFEFKSEGSKSSLNGEESEDFHIAYACIAACRKMHPFEFMGVLETAPSAACIVVYMQDQLILIDAIEKRLAEAWVLGLKVLSRRAQVEFMISASLAVEPCDGCSIEELLRRSKSQHSKNEGAWVWRQSSAIDVLNQSDEPLPVSLPVRGLDRDAGLPQIPGTLSSTQTCKPDASLSLRLELPRTISGGNEMSCRNTTPGPTPRKKTDLSPRPTPGDKRAAGEIFEAVSLTADEAAAREQFIAAVEMFKGLRPRDANALAEKIKVLSASAGQKIMSEGSLGSTMVRILMGVATAYQTSSSLQRAQDSRPSPRAVGTLQRGDLYGQAELFQHCPTEISTFIIAEMDCKYVMLSKADLMGLLEARDSLRAKLIDNASWLAIDSAWLLSLGRQAPNRANYELSEWSENTDNTERTDVTERSVTRPRKVPGRLMDEIPVSSWTKSTEGKQRKRPEKGRPGEAQADSDLSDRSEARAAKRRGQRSERKTEGNLDRNRRSDNMPRDDSVPVCLSAGSIIAEDGSLFKRNKDMGSDVGAAASLSDATAGLTLSSNGPQPVYFSAEPAVKLDSKVSSSDSMFNGMHKRESSEGTSQQAATTKANKHQHHETGAGRADLNVKGEGPEVAAASTPKGRAEAHTSDEGQKMNRTLSPVTPIVNREHQAAYLNNNVVLPPGASKKLASRLNRKTPQKLSPEGSQSEGTPPDTPPSLSDKDMDDSWS
jgi:CRP-like cAMP-binding protein